MGLEAWNSIEKLVEALGIQEESNISYEGRSCGLFDWMEGENYLATARETYSWRRVIDSIKDADLTRLDLQIQEKGRTQPTALVRSKPIMLRVAGEITNALIHSYARQHKIRFAQRDFIDPSAAPM
jgi:hypothetical protein